MKRKLEDEEMPIVVKLPKTDFDQKEQQGTYIEIDGKSCFHRLVSPDNTRPTDQTPPSYQGPFARDFPFDLDPFQKLAIGCLEAGKN